MVRLMEYQGKSASDVKSACCSYIFSCDNVFKKSSLGFLFYLPPLSNSSTDRQTETHTYTYVHIIHAYLSVCVTMLVCVCMNVMLLNIFLDDAHSFVCMLVIIVV